MGLVTMREMAAHAMAGRYAVGAFNVYDWDSLYAVLEAAEAEASPVIVQLSMGARRSTPAFGQFFQAVMAAARACVAPVAVQHDHCPTAQAAEEALAMGFPAVMFDGSHLPPEENARQTAHIARLAHAQGAWVEAELGAIPGFEDMVFAEHAQLTDPDMAVRFVGESACDALAVSVGTSHGGVLAEGPLVLHDALLADIHAHLPGVPLVLHGAASVPEALVQAVNAVGGQVQQVYNCAEADIARTGALGVFKLNMDVDNHLLWNAAVRRDLIENPQRYDPRPVLRAGREAFGREVTHKLRQVCGTAGKAWPAGEGS